MTATEDANKPSQIVRIKLIIWFLVAIPASWQLVPNDALVEPPVRRPVRLLNAGSWLRDLPYGVVLVLTLVGVAYTSFSKHPIVAYWEFLVPVMGVVCIGTGWHPRTTSKLG